MVYVSERIDNLALLFEIIDKVTDDYASWGLLVEHEIVISSDGIRIKFEPYDGLRQC